METRPVTLSAAIALATAAVLSLQPAPAAQGDGRVHVELFSLYERNEYAAFTERISSYPPQREIGPFRKAAENWIRDGEPKRRRLIVAAVAVEVAAASPSWIAGRALLDAGRKWLRDSGASELRRHWYRAALASALAHSDADLLLAREDFRSDETITRSQPEYGRYANEALAQFRDDETLKLLQAIAFELKAAMSGRAEWFDKEAIERHVQSIKRRRDSPPLPPTARMDLESVERLRKPDVRESIGDQLVAYRSEQLWRVADMFRRLQQHQGVASEATVRLATTYIRLARPDLAEAELERAASSTATPFVRFVAHFLRAREFARLNRDTDTENAYRLALDAVPNAQSAAFGLAPILFTSGRRAEAERLVSEAVSPPLVTDPIKVYGGGDPAHLRDALSRLREASR